MAEHKDLTGNKLHTPFRWVFDDAAARIAEAVTSDDVGKIAWQQDDDTLWGLNLSSPVTWKQLGGVPTITTKGDLIVGDANGAPARLAYVANGKILGAVAGQPVWIDVPPALPPGTPYYYAGTSAPEGGLIRNGAAISRTSYAKLFAVIGTTYGAGNGTTTFNLPDDRNLFIRGVPSGGIVGTYQADDFKSHAHTVHGYGTISGGSGLMGKYSGSVGTSSTGGAETRPKNRQYLPIIQY